jgi:hypothetical protein
VLRYKRYSIPYKWWSSGHAGAFAGRQLTHLTSLITTAGPHVGPARPPCNYPFPTLTSVPNSYNDPINHDLDMLPTGTFTIHPHPTLHDTTIPCTPNGRAVTTLSGPRIRHLFQLFRPDLTHRSFEEEVYHLMTRLGSR